LIGGLVDVPSNRCHGEALPPRTINLEQKLMVVMAAPVTSNKLPAIGGVISRAE
jgi:hypothetical protein